MLYSELRYGAHTKTRSTTDTNTDREKHTAGTEAAEGGLGMDCWTDGVPVRFRFAVGVAVQVGRTWTGLFSRQAQSMREGR